MVRTRVTPTNKLLGAEGSLPTSEVFSQGQIALGSIPAIRQHDSYCLHNQQRRHPFPTDFNPSTGVVVLVRGRRHLSDSLSHPRKRQCVRGHRIKGIQRHEWMEVESNHHPTLSAELSDGSVCKSPDHSAQGLHQLEARPRDHPHRCSIHWAPLKSCSFPSLEKVMVGKTEIILVAPFWQAQHWWPVLLKLLISQLVLLLNSPTLLMDPSDLKRVHPMYL